MRKQKSAPVDQESQAHLPSGNGQSEKQTGLWISFRCGKFSCGEVHQPSSGDYWNLNVKTLRAEALRLKEQLKSRIEQDEGFAHIEFLDENTEKYAAEIESQAGELEDLQHCPEKAQELVDRYGESEFQTAPKLFVLSEAGNENALELIATVAKKHSEYLAILAERGNEEAVRLLAKISIATTTSLNELAIENPQALKSVAARNLQWPILSSSFPALQIEPDWQELGLGSTLPLELDPGRQRKRRFNINTPAGKIAYQLLLYVCDLRTNAQLHQKRIKGRTSSFDELPGYHSDAAELTAFSADSVWKWWDVALACLIDAFPNRTNPAQLDETVPVLNQLVTAKAHRKSAGTIRSRIIEKIQESFYSIAGGKR